MNIPPEVKWRTSSHTGGDGGNCVEVATNVPALVIVRDSKDRGGPVLVFGRDAWGDFLGEVKGGRFSTI
jgi:hypothetical protein